MSMVSLNDFSEEDIENIIIETTFLLQNNWKRISSSDCKFKVPPRYGSYVWVKNGFSRTEYVDVGGWEDLREVDFFERNEAYYAQLAFNEGER